jgi:hypothetical protein
VGTGKMGSGCITVVFSVFHVDSFCGLRTEYTVSIQHEFVCVINCSVRLVQFSELSDSQHILILLQCSFIPKFSISIKTKFENNNGSSENVSFFV